MADNQEAAAKAPKMPRSSFPSSGFSLVEVVMSLAIVSFAMVSLVGLVGVALDTSRASIETTRQAQITQKIFSDVQVTAWKKVGDHYQFDPVKTERYFNYDGQELESATDPELHFTARLIAGPITWPSAEAPPSGVATNLTVEIVNVTQPNHVNAISTVVVRTGS